MIKNLLFSLLVLLALGLVALLLLPIFFDGSIDDVTDKLDLSTWSQAETSQENLHSENSSETSHPPVQQAPPGHQPSGFIKVKGAALVDENEYQIIFKGLAIADQDKIFQDGQWNKKHFEVIKSWGANLIRIPIHPERFRKRGQEYYLKLLDEAVAWCADLEMYVIIDWHSIGNLKTGLFEANEYKTSIKETLGFWATISERFAGNSTVAFYEIFNEPTLAFGDFGNCTWAQWKTIVEKIIDTIYANDPEVIPLVAGFDWAYNLKDVKTNPIDRPGVAYFAHPYPGKCKPPREPHWEENFGFLADRYPIVATEMGYILDGDFEYMIDDGTFRHAILKFLKRKKISWCVWVFDPDWSPSLVKSYQYEPTHCGQFFKKAMSSRE